MKKRTIEDVRLRAATKLWDGRRMIKSYGTQQAGYKMLIEGRTLAMKAENFNQQKRKKSNV